MDQLTDADRRDAALFTADVFRQEYSRLRHRLTPHETVIAALGVAKAILDAATGSALPSQPGSHWLSRWLPASGGAAFSSRTITQAERTARYFQIAGDHPSTTAASITMDRKVTEALAEQRAAVERNGDGTAFVPNDSIVARKLRLSHTQIRERRLARCARTMAALHRDCPDIWDANGLPVREVRGTGRVWDSRKAA